LTIYNFAAFVKNVCNLLQTNGEIVPIANNR